MTEYIRLTEPPQWCIQYPTCSACTTELDTDGDGWTCPTCGTSWDMDANDGDTGTLYADWSGEEPTGPEVASDDAHHWGYYREQMGRHQMFPDLVPEPTRPTTGATR